MKLALLSSVTKRSALSNSLADRTDAQREDAPGSLETGAYITRTVLSDCTGVQSLALAANRLVTHWL
jgi:hypothetical protein